ncbi:hypothetical protein QEN58_09650 [Halomonas alkaliantarctica]|uniref:Uncharacterized protein n=1 Tax=Halomonas alkaliantarctica TaxID=232346 RepID=A0ABY8LGM1_9GAMM|nr:hypothetical protein [Halomonas alkaliantarctica]WGI23621.1 hypothetical protein QEN58_09650 [Halomonas alkaliantarctica]
MGKARILQAHGEGRYTIEIVEARERAELAKEEAEARIQTLRTQITALEQRIASAQATVNQAAAEQDAAINQYQQEIVEKGQSSINLDAFSRDLLEATSQRDELQAEQRAKELRIAADEALVARINAFPPLRQMQAWCADYTEDLSGEVATAEVPGEIGNVIIKPGFHGTAWSAAADGAIQPTLASTPAATFYNLAMLPGWQKWRPTFRTASITSLDGDSCSITLDAATSSQQGLDVNAQASYSNVPILYMDCNGDAFEAGDKVLVAFAGNVEGPTVVGFESNPSSCRSITIYSANRDHMEAFLEEHMEKGFQGLERVRYSYGISGTSEVITPLAPDMSSMWLAWDSLNEGDSNSGTASDTALNDIPISHFSCTTSTAIAPERSISIVSDRLARLTVNFDFEGVVSQTIDMKVGNRNITFEYFRRYSASNSWGGTVSDLSGSRDFNGYFDSRAAQSLEDETGFELDLRINGTSLLLPETVNHYQGNIETIRDLYIVHDKNRGPDDVFIYLWANAYTTYAQPGASNFDRYGYYHIIRINEEGKVFVPDLAELPPEHRQLSPGIATIIDRYALRMS